MTSKTLSLLRLQRSPKYDDNDDLRLELGVNVIVGEKDAGKTGWLQMLDFCLGDTDKPSEAFGEVLADKYESVKATISIDSSIHTLERRWKEDGQLTKVFVDNIPISAEEFSDVFLDLLEIPRLTFPRGNPYSQTRWPQLSWRSMYRHIYRREKFWTAFADKQPDVDQAACLLQFLGAAEFLFPHSRNDLIQRRKELDALRAKRDAFASILKTLSAELTENGNLADAVTIDSVNEAVERIDAEMTHAMEQRSILLSQMQAQRTSEFDRLSKGLMAERQASSEAERELTGSARSLKERIKELEEYASNLRAELGRFERAEIAAASMVDLQVTHCPACDKPIRVSDQAEDRCFVCHQQLGSEDVDESSARARVEFERQRLKEELEELEELVKSHYSQAALLERRLVIAAKRTLEIDRDLAPARALAAHALPPDLALIDQQIGKLREQMAQVERVRRATESQAELQASISELEIQERALAAEVVSKEDLVNLNELSERLESRMNDYLAAIDAIRPGTWDGPQITILIREREIVAKIGRGQWSSQVGAVSQALVLFAYHYALLSITAEQGSNYPGLVVLDFPIQLADSVGIGNQENYVLQPFVDLCKAKPEHHLQVIAAGRAFDGLEVANRIVLHKPKLKVGPDIGG